MSCECVVDVAKQSLKSLLVGNEEDPSLRRLDLVKQLFCGCIWHTLRGTGLFESGLERSLLALERKSDADQRRLVAPNILSHFSFIASRLSSESSFMFNLKSPARKSRRGLFSLPALDR